jgi:putative heme transporter
VSPEPPRSPGPAGLERTRLERLGAASWALIGIILLVILAFMLFSRYSGLLVPAAIGIVLAVTLSPLVALLAHWHVPRIVGTLLVTLLIVAAMALLAWQFVVIVLDDSGNILHLLRSATADVDRWIGSGETAQAALAKIQDWVGTLEHAVASGLMPIAYESVRAVYSLAVAVVLAGGFMFFFLWQGPLVREWVSGHIFLPAPVGRRVTRSLVHTSRMYVLGVSCIGLMEAVIVGGTALVTGVNSWAVIAFAIFLGNYIPYVGGLVAGVFAVLLALGAGGPGPALAVLIAVVVSFVFAGPHIGVFFIGGALKMPVAAVFTLTMAGAAVLGFFGAAAAAPVARLVMDAHAIIKEARADETQAAEEPATASPPALPREPEAQAEG